MKNLLKILLSATFLLLSCLAFAGATLNENIPNMGLYFQGELGIGGVGQFANTHFDSFTPVGSLGYQFTRYFALEARYQYISSSNSGFFQGSHSDRDNQVTGNIKIILPLIYNVDIFGTAGVGADFRRRTANGVVSNTSPTVVPLGVGADYNITRQIAWTIGVDSTIGGSRITSATTGLKYTFS